MIWEEIRYSGIYILSTHLLIRIKQCGWSKRNLMFISFVIAKFTYVHCATNYLMPNLDVYWQNITFWNAWRKIQLHFNSSCSKRFFICFKINNRSISIFIYRPSEELQTYIMIKTVTILHQSRIKNSLRTT